MMPDQWFSFVLRSNVQHSSSRFLFFIPGEVWKTSETCEWFLTYWSYNTGLSKVKRSFASDLGETKICFSRLQIVMHVTFSLHLPRVGIFLCFVAKGNHIWCSLPSCYVHSLLLLVFGIQKCALLCVNYKIKRSLK